MTWILDRFKVEDLGKADEKTLETCKGLKAYQVVLHTLKYVNPPIRRAYFKVTYEAGQTEVVKEHSIEGVLKHFHESGRARLVER